MDSNADHAVGMFTQGFNCAQSVLAACGRPYGLDQDQACHIAQAFGGGMCLMDQTCGAVTGALMVIGLKHGKTTADDTPKIKAQQLTHEFAERFIARHGSLRCTRLLGHNLSVPDEISRARALGLFEAVCPRLVHDAAEIVDQVLQENERQP